MNFDFDDAQKVFINQVSQFFSQEASYEHLRAHVSSGAEFAKAPWRRAGELGWLGATFPDVYGGSGLRGYELCLLSEAVGRAVAPFPLSSSICLVGEAIRMLGNDHQKSTWLPRLASGERIGAFMFSEGPGCDSERMIGARVEDGMLVGQKWPVADGSAAHVAVVVAKDQRSRTVIALADLSHHAVDRRPLDTIDTLRPHAVVSFEQVPVEPLGDPATGARDLQRILDNAAVFTAFEQIGGAQAALDMALGHAKQRYAFGRPIGGFQAIKHKLTDMYVKTELARSNAYYAAWAMANNAPQRVRAAAAARLSATEAYKFGARENLQIHGGAGYTLSANCHWHYRRALLLAVNLGSVKYWSDRLIDELQYDAA